MMKGLRVVWFALAVLASPVVCSAQTLPPTPEQRARVCGVSPPATALDYTFDASTGIASGFLKHRKSDRVRVIVTNKNPFLYEYKVTIAETPVPEPDLGGFLKLLGGPAVDLLPAATAPAAGAAAVAAGSGALPTAVIDLCNKRFAAITAQHAVVAAARAKADAELAKQKAAYDKLAAGVKKAEAVFNSNALCDELYSTANVVRGDIAAYDPKLDAFEEAIAVLSSAIKEQDANLAAFPADCPQDVSSYRETNRAQHTALDQLRAALKLLTAEKARFEALGEKIDPILASPTSFTEVRQIGDYDVPTNVKITIERKERVDKAVFQPMLTVTTRFGGGARFAVAGGWSWSALRKPQYVPVQGFPIDRAGNVVAPETLAPVVGTTERSASRNGPLAALHTRILPEVKGWSRFYLTLAITAKNDNKGTDPEYLVGPSVSFAEERAFLTVGLYGGRLQELQGQLYEGGPIPKDLAAIPVEKNLHWKLGVALTWKVK
jgi:hypothetical protein